MWIIWQVCDFLQLSSEHNTILETRAKLWQFQRRLHDLSWKCSFSMCHSSHECGFFSMLLFPYLSTMRALQVLWDATRDKRVSAPLAIVEAFIQSIAWNWSYAAYHDEPTNQNLLIRICHGWTTSLDHLPWNVPIFCHKSAEMLIWAQDIAHILQIEFILNINNFSGSSTLNVAGLNFNLQ